MVKPSSKTRIKDIAEMAGVSIGTVDRVIHNRGEVSAKTRERIEEIIKKLNYEPDVIASALASKRKIKFAVLIPSIDKESIFWKSISKGIDMALEESKHFGIESKLFYFNQFESKAFVKSAHKMIKYQPNAVLIAPVFSEEIVAIVDDCTEKEISVAFINSNVESVDTLSYIGQDSRQSGYVAAKLLTYGIEENASILVINISLAIKNHKHILKRNIGFENFITENNLTNIEIHNIDIEDTNEVTINKNLEKVFKEIKNIKGIFVSNSRVSKVAKYLEKNGLTKIRLIGYDLIQDNIPYLENGIIDFLISQNPIKQGYDGIMTLVNNEILKKKIEKKNLLPIDIITKENIKYYLKN